MEMCATQITGNCSNQAPCGWKTAEARKEQGFDLKMPARHGFTFFHVVKQRKEH
jgi:hypothetical protein